jgi:hydrogenase-1 operon protein HyaE
MTTGGLRDLADRHAMPIIDGTTVEAFLAPAGGEAEHAILFFAGDPAQRPETSDVAVILPELARVFAGRVRVALVAPGHEGALKDRFQVLVLPSLVVLRGGLPVEVLPKVLDWSEYVRRIEAALAPDAPQVRPRGPATLITVSAAGGSL